MNTFEEYKLLIVSEEDGDDFLKSMKLALKNVLGIKSNLIDTKKIKLIRKEHGNVEIRSLTKKLEDYKIFIWWIYTTENEIFSLYKYWKKRSIIFQNSWRKDYDCDWMAMNGRYVVRVPFNLREVIELIKRGNHV